MQHGYLQRELPPELSDLSDLVIDLRWNNCAAARHLWSHFDHEMWTHTENPLMVLESAHQERIDAAAGDTELLSELANWRREVEQYYSHETEFSRLDPDGSLKLVAYFSMEYGLSESLPIYSGGLGMLAGDHLKTASDLGVPLVAIGLLYQQGYFRQVIGNSGDQLEAYPFNDPGSLPVKPLLDDDGRWIRIELPLPDRRLFLRVWEAKVGRVRLFLLDSNVAMNAPWDRGITAQLYDADRERRLLQEIVLGVGGWNLVERLDLGVDVCHLNEGHAAFAVLARAAGFARRYQVTLAEAFTATRAGNVFTTHTPVEAAFDRFDPAMLGYYARPFLQQTGFEFEDLLMLGRSNRDDPSEPFNMAWLAMSGCSRVNAVSELHSEVSRELFSSLFPRWPHKEVPIRAVTNGVHVPTWASQRAARLWGEGPDGSHLWLEGIHRVTQNVQQLTAEELWTFRTQQRKALVSYVGMRQRAGNRSADHTRATFDPNALTLGFARRFATYKRANLLISDPDRMKRLLLDEHRPVQLVVAGKAHPNDGFGKALVREMTEFLGQPELAGRAIFLDDYDMVVGQHLVAGVDVWLNTPLRPNEACGTSGMKILVNGGLHVSVPDGWWDEATEPDFGDVLPGWIVGSRFNGSLEEMNVRDVVSLFDVLENEVIPEFYDRDENGIPERWIERVRTSMTRLTPRFSATRMLHQYIEESYLPAAQCYAERTAEDAALAREIREWSDYVRAHWHNVRIGQVRTPDDSEPAVISVECWLDGLSPEHVRVELFSEHSTATIVLPERRELPGSVNGHLYSGHVPGDIAGEFTVRVVPYHPKALIPAENQCIHWNH